MRCHARGRDRGGFSIETRERMLDGGDSGAALVPGDSAESHLIALVAGLDPDEVMPKKGSRLTSDQIGLLRAWIDQGAAWDPASTSRVRRRRTSSRARPSLPPDGAACVTRSIGSSTPISPSNTIDAGSAQSMTGFVRRVTSTSIGVLPPPRELARVRRRHGARQARAAGRAAAGRQPALRRALADLLERPAAQRLPRHRATSTADASRSRPGSTRRSPTTCRTTGSSPRW